MTWRDLFGWRKKDVEIEDEIESHFQLAIQDRIERGQSPRKPTGRRCWNVAACGS